MKDFQAHFDDLLCLVHTLMIKLRQLIPAAKLCRLTHLKSRCRNATRWSSSFQMLDRYEKIRDVLPKLGLDYIDELLQSARQTGFWVISMSCYSLLAKTVKSIRYARNFEMWIQ